MIFFRINTVMIEPPTVLLGRERCGDSTFQLRKRMPDVNQEWPRQTKPKKGQFMNFPQGHSGTKVQCES